MTADPRGFRALKLYLEPFSGLSGDMFLGALCGLTGAYGRIRALPNALRLPEARVVFEEVRKNGIACTQVRIIDQSLGSDVGSDANAIRHGALRSLTDLLVIVEAGDLSVGAKRIAGKILTTIAETEAAIHGKPIDQIHFHEIGAVDTLLDIVGCAVLLDILKVERTFSDPVCTGFGSVTTLHGLLPVPAPATAALLLGMSTYKGDEPGERVTPSGAAILHYLQPDFGLPPLIVERISYGAGQKTFRLPNVLRASVVEVADICTPMATVNVIECNIDDAPAEHIGADFQNNLLSIGALDVFLTPILMKKGRPGVKVSVLVPASCLREISDYILEKTSTVGLRYYSVFRRELDRNIFTVQTEYGPIKVKEVTKPSGRKKCKIEYESLRNVSERTGNNLQEVEFDLHRLLESRDRGSKGDAQLR